MNTFTSMADGILEWELTLPAHKLLSHAWYHGALSRIDAENLLQEDRQFLVRESTSQRDNYVLSCRSNGQHLHFVIQKIEINPDTVYKRCQYQFEDEAYDQVPDLITSYVGSGKPISAASGARIQYPVNRTVPLTEYDQDPKPDVNLVEMQDLRRVLSHYNLLNNGACVRDPKTQRLRRTLVQNLSKMAPQGQSISGANPPAKPARNEAPREEDQPEVQDEPSHLDSGNASGDSAQSCPQNNTFEEPLLSSKEYNFNIAEEKLNRFGDLNYIAGSLVDLANFNSQILTRDHHKPLESEVLSTIKYLLRISGPRILANHMTKVDTDFLYRDVIHMEGMNQRLPCIDMCFLPQGKQLRMDILDRLECFRMLVGVTILTCMTNEQRADMINDWILLAVEVKNALGNLYGFTSIMLGLTMKQVEALDETWATLRRLHTDHALLFDSQLRPMFTSLMSGNHCLPPNTTAPNILPTVLCFQLFEENAETATENMFDEYIDIPTKMDYYEFCGHMNSAMDLTVGKEDFIKNARSVIQAKSSRGPIFDPILLELFQIEFHIKFLWGDGPGTKREGRYARMKKVLDVLLERAKAGVSSSRSATSSSSSTSSSPS